MPINQLLWIPVGVGAVIALTGLAMAIGIWRKKDVRDLEPATAPPAGPWDALIKVVEVIARFTPRPYRFPVALMMLGGAIMIASIGIGAATGGVK